MPTLHIASTNPGKLQEFATAARPGGWTIAVLPYLADLPQPVEDAPTFTGNADLKAVAYSLAAPGHLVLADDSGLEVDALGGRPGVLSARFADAMNFEPELHQRSSKDDRNNRCLLSLLGELHRATGAQFPDGPAPGARFFCALSVARDGHILVRAEGAVEGEITFTPRGSDGFGYDPLFVVRSRGLTLAELTPAKKWSLSHRGNAFRSLLQQLPGVS